MKSTVIILSGGMDSATLLYDWIGMCQASQSNPETHIEALSFDYGQKHKKELKFAKKLCKKFRINHQIVDIRSIKNLISNSALTSDEEIPEGHYEDKSMKKTVVPNRNMIMLSIAIGYAENIGFDCVSIANHAGDHAIYPDCRSEFISVMSAASQLGTYKKVEVYAPYSRLSKIDIAEKGLYMGIDFDKETWSCYKGGFKHCKKCGTCVERFEALKIANERMKARQNEK